MNRQRIRQEQIFLSAPNRQHIFLLVRFDDDFAVFVLFARKFQGNDLAKFRVRIAILLILIVVSVEDDLCSDKKAATSVTVLILEGDNVLFAF